MKISHATVLVTGANRGLGKALVDEALRRGAKRIYAGARQPFSHPDHRVVPLVLTSRMLQRFTRPFRTSIRSTFSSTMPASRSRVS